MHRQTRHPWSAVGKHGYRASPPLPSPPRVCRKRRPATGVGTQKCHAPMARHETARLSDTLRALATTPIRHIRQRNTKQYGLVAIDPRLSRCSDRASTNAVVRHTEGKHHALHSSGFECADNGTTRRTASVPVTCGSCPFARSGTRKSGCSDRSLTTIPGRGQCRGPRSATGSRTDIAPSSPAGTGIPTGTRPGKIS